MATKFGKIYLSNQKIQFSAVLSAHKIGLQHIEGHAWSVRLRDYDLACFEWGIINKVLRPS